MDCLFCKIFQGHIPSKKVYEDDNVFAFHDISPMAKTHILFIHKKHTANVNGLSTIHVGQVFTAIKTYVATTDLEKSGFRIVTNTGPDVGQTVFHAHFHLLGGEKLKGFGA
ncbi:MAG: HIT domain-containing protein [Proteobacteria bacterium]|jgi:histidine triad (HIT) family protein|nr:HIT domain-containing protein [Pseudomonadota bacterium]